MALLIYPSMIEIGTLLCVKDRIPIKQVRTAHYALHRCGNVILVHISKPVGEHVWVGYAAF